MQQHARGSISLLVSILKLIDSIIIPENFYGKQLSYTVSVVLGKIRSKFVLVQVRFGRGWALIRGVPVHRYSQVESAIAYWGFGLYWGSARSQNAKGHILGHVKVPPPPSHV